jgi:hypothetical protein
LYEKGVVNDTVAHPDAALLGNAPEYTKVYPTVVVVPLPSAVAVECLKYILTELTGIEAFPELLDSAN